MVLNTGRLDWESSIEQMKNFSPYQIQKKTKQKNKKKQKKTKTKTKKTVNLKCTDSKDECNKPTMKKITTMV